MPNAPDLSIKIGIFFGGQSREREVSFSGGRTVYDQLDRRFFDPIPIFVDSLGQFILLNWSYLYQGTIREFYPGLTQLGIPLYIESLNNLSSKAKEQAIQKIGKRIQPEAFAQYFDFAFLCLHGLYGEDGSIQSILQWYNIPYSGSGILPSAISADKVYQKQLLASGGFLQPRSYILEKAEWMKHPNRSRLLSKMVAKLGIPMVSKSSKQGSSIGVAYIQVEKLDAFTEAVNQSFFIEELSIEQWKGYTLDEKKRWLAKVTDVREGIGFPLYIHHMIFYTPSHLMEYIDRHFESQVSSLVLEGVMGEGEIILESLILGREFSCIVLELEKGKPLALPLTEMVKQGRHFDYTAKYLPGIVRKVTPMPLPQEVMLLIQQQAIDLFTQLKLQVYARIDGFLTKNNEVILNDPNATSGMNPASFLFHQAAEIGLNPTQLLTFLIKRSLQVSIQDQRSMPMALSLLSRLDAIMGIK